MNDGNYDSGMVMRMAAKLQGFMTTSSVYNEHIITTKHIHLLPRFTVLILNAYDDGYDAAEHSWCDVWCGLVLECSHFTERGREWVVCVCVAGLESMIEGEAVL